MSRAGQVASSAAHHADSGVLRAVGRAGLIAYGLVYLLVAFLAVQIALGRSEQADQAGALQTVASQPFGRTLLWVIVGALAALVLWQLVDVVFGRRYLEGRERARQRISSAGKAMAYGTIAFNAGRIAAGGSSNPGQEEESAVATVLDVPGGQLLVGLAGAVVVALAVSLVVKGVTGRFRKDLDFSGADRRARRTAVGLGRVGWSALGVAYGILGILVVVAAVTHDPEQVGGLDAALSTLVAQPFGQVLLLIVAAGVAAFGVYCFFDARYRRV